MPNAAGAASSATDQAGAEAVQETTTNDGEGGDLNKKQEDLRLESHPVSLLTHGARIPPDLRLDLSNFWGPYHNLRPNS